MFRLALFYSCSDAVFMDVDIIYGYVKKSRDGSSVEAYDEITEYRIVSFAEFRHFLAEVGHDHVKILVKHGFKLRAVWRIILDFFD